MSSQDQNTVDQSVTPLTNERLATHDVLTTLHAVGCGRFAEAAVQAGLEHRLHGPNLTTVFAPADEAFGSVPSVGAEQITALVNKHAMAGQVTLADLKLAREIRLLDGSTVPAVPEEGTLRVGQARIQRSDVACTNGMVQVMDGLIG